MFAATGLESHEAEDAARRASALIDAQHAVRGEIAIAHGSLDGDRDLTVSLGGLPAHALRS